MLRKIINLLVVALLVVLVFFEGVYLGPNFGSSSEVVRRYHLSMYSNPAMWNLRWLGIHTMQNPNDVWIIQEIISEIRPDFIIEAGTASGGSAIIWAMILREANPSGRVITIDIVDQKTGQDLSPSVRENIDFLIGSSVDPAIVETVQKRTQGKRVLVLLDSDHHESHVFKELECYSPMVSVGSYLIVEDTNINGHPVFLADGENKGPGPMEAVDRFLPLNPQFQIDKTREKLLFTMHPNGYLKRVR